MATAAVADAASKDQRRKELDSKIDDARDKLAKLLEVAPAYEPKRTRDGPYVLHNANQTPLGIYDALTSICVMPSRLLKEASRRGNRVAYLRSLRKELGLKEEREWWKTPPSRLGETDDMVAQEETVGHAFQHREPVNATQFSKQRERINNLVDQLLVETYRRPDGTPSAPDLLESAWNNIRMLRSSGYPNYQHPSLDPAAAAEARRDLSAVTRNIFRDWKTYKDHLISISPYGRVDDRHLAKYIRRREYFVGKICHNLLIARFAPGIHNYNTLISGFKTVGESRFGQAVVDSFLNSRMKPTPMTLVAVFQHYNQGDIIGVYNMIRRITGDDPKGLLLRSKPVTDVKDDPTLFSWAQTADAAVGHGFVTERPVLSEVVVEALLDRLIDFRMVRHAVTVLGACLRERWAISADYVRRAIGLCVAQVDRIAAVELLRILLRDGEQFSRIIAASISGQHGGGLLHFVHRLVQICDISADRDLIKHAANTESPSLPNSLGWSSRLAYLRTALWSAFAEQEVDEVASCARSLSAVLASDPMDGEQLEAISARMERMKQRHQAADIENQRFQALATIDSINTECEVGLAKMRSFEHDLIQILFRKPKHQVFDIRFDPSIPVEYRLQLLSPMEVAEVRAVRSAVNALVQRADELNKETEHLLYDTLPVAERRRLWKLLGRRQRVFAAGHLVKHWSQYLHELSRQWTELGNGLSTAESRRVSPRKHQVRTGEYESRAAFFESREPLDRVKLPVTAV
ncbi:hypothetical protein NKR19_g767 [Coniochaeta hoffmannii]|uniref:Pentatricopeptide repeat domain-containing protein n=1 Tax=Coniochaeta hoffmannii TaxID=91930 RepID=A0AA38S127_9PEZI|nr:hypothetical protein NKR19_g767 [Coniochaeta hoffmannii]